MKKGIFFVVLIPTILFTFVYCPFSVNTKDDNGGEILTKTLRLTIWRDYHGCHSTTSTTYTIYDEHPGSILIKFKKSDYSVSSINFVGLLRSKIEGIKSSIALYNLTDGEMIPNTELTTTSSDKYTIVESGNMIDYLPEKEINLCVQFKSSDPINDAEIRGAYLFLHL